MTECCVITAGELRHRVYLEKRVRVADGQGGYTETWVADPIGGVLAKMQFLTGTERWEDYRNKPGNLIRLTMRFKGDADDNPYWQAGKHRAKFRNRYFDILAISDVNWEGKAIKMDLFESGPS